MEHSKESTNMQLLSAQNMSHKHSNKRLETESATVARVNVGDSDL